MATQVKEKSAPSAGKHDAFIAATLARAASRIRLIDLAAALLGLVGGILAFAVSMALLDRQFVLSAATRQAALVLFLAAAAAYLYLLVVRPLTWRVNPHYAARCLEETVPAGRNHVINWIDGQNEKVPGAIRTALGQKAARDLVKADLDRAISGQRAGLAGAVSGACALAFIALFVLIGPRPFFSLLARAFAPFGTQTGIATRTEVHIRTPEGGNATVIIGNPVTIVAEIVGRIPDARASDAPCLLYRHEEGEPWRQRFLRSDESGREWVTTIAATDVGNGFTYKVTAGDGTTAEYRITVRAAPLIAEFLATYHYRPYVGRADRTRTQRHLHDLRGTEVAIVARTNRVVQDGRIDFDADGGGGDVLHARKVPDDPQALAFRLVLDRPGRYRLRFTSALGETYIDPQMHSITVIDDLPPEVRLTEPGKDVTLPANGHLEIKGEASDDIGIARAGLCLRIVGGLGKKLRTLPYLADQLGQPALGTPTHLDYHELLVLRDLVDEQGKAVELKPGMVIEYWLEVHDACDFPAPHSGESRRFRITIAGSNTNPQHDKEQGAARQRNKEQQAQQQEQLKKEQEDRQAQRQREEAQERADQKEREKQREEKAGGKGEDGAKDRKEKDSEKKGGKEKGGKEKGGKGEQGDHGNEGGAGSDEQKKRDEETRRQAEDLKRALDQRNQDGKGENTSAPGKAKDANAPKPPEGGRPGEGRDEGNGKEKAGENREGSGQAGEHNTARPEGAAQPDTQTRAGGGKAKDGTPPGKGKSGTAERNPPAEGRDGGAGDMPQDAGQDRSGTAPRPENGAGEGRAAPEGPEAGRNAAGEAREGAGAERGRSGSGGANGEKGKAEKAQAEKATVKDVEKLQQDMQRGAGQARQEAARDLDAIRREARDPAAREAAGKALEQAKKDFAEGKLDQTPPRQPAEAKSPGKPEEATKQDVDNLSKSLGSKDPQEKAWAREQMQKIQANARNPEARQRALEELERAWDLWLKERDKGSPSKADRPEASRPSTLQLEQFRKKVDRDVLRDARMSREQFDQFLKDYADLVRRQPKDEGGAGEVLPAPSSAGTLPATVGRGGTPGTGKVDDLRNEGRAKPPPGYRDAYADFLQRLKKTK